MTATWLGRYEFEVGKYGDEWLDNPAVYIFVRRGGHREPEPLYIGQTQGLAHRLRQHKNGKWREARQAGATEIHAMVVYSRADRKRIERKLIEAYRPTLLNIQQSF